MVLFGLQNRTLGPFLAAIKRILISVTRGMWRRGDELGELSSRGSSFCRFARLRCQREVAGAAAAAEAAAQSSHEAAMQEAQASHSRDLSALQLSAAQMLESREQLASKCVELEAQVIVWTEQSWPCM
jgi:hypothetical protein